MGAGVVGLGGGGWMEGGREREKLYNNVFIHTLHRFIRRGERARATLLLKSSSQPGATPAEPWRFCALVNLSAMGTGRPSRRAVSREASNWSASGSATPLRPCRRRGVQCRRPVCVERLRPLLLLRQRRYHLQYEHAAAETSWL